MPPAAEQFEYLPGVLAIGWLSENVTFTFGHRIAADDDAPIDAEGDILGLLKGEAGDKLRRRLATAPRWRSAFGRLVGRNDREVVAGLHEELPPPGRGTGKDDGKSGHGNGSRRSGVGSQPINFLLFAALKLARFS